MSEKELLKLFLEYGLTDKEKQFLSKPMNSQHEKMFTAFKRGYAIKGFEN